MKKILLLTCFLVSTGVHAQATYHPLDEQGTVTFSIRNFGVKVDGSLKGIDGEIYFDPERPESGKFRITLDAATINTGIDLRDNHLRKEDYFYVNKYRIIKFNSSKIYKGNSPNSWIVNGYLNLKGITKEISIPFTFDDVTENKFKFSGEFTIDRRDFEIGGRSISLSDDVTIKLDVMAMKMQYITN